MDFSREWRSLRNLEEARRKILDSDQPYEPSPQLQNLPLRDCKAILDCMCGMGRNIPGLLKLAPNAHIIGYDLPNIIELAKQDLGMDVFRKIEWISPPPAILGNYSYDFVIADLALQHLGESELRLILSILKDRLQTDGKLWVSGRWWTEDEKSVWTIVLDYFDSITTLDLSAAVGNNHQNVLFRPKSAK
jgi:hypothetical protein